MARMVPDTPPAPDAAGMMAERKVWHALKAGLGPKWTVYHDCLVDAGDSHSPQLDFVVVHPRYGLAVIEVKASAWQRGAGGSPYVFNRGAREWNCVRRSPYRQARDGLMVLRKALIDDGLRGCCPGHVPMAAMAYLPDMTGRYAHRIVGNGEGREMYFFGDDIGLEKRLIRLLRKDGRPVRRSAWIRLVERRLGGHWSGQASDAGRLRRGWRWGLAASVSALVALLSFRIGQALV